MLQITITVVIEKDTEGYYAYTPALKGLHVGGETKEEAVSNAKDAALVYLESLLKHNDPLPIGPGLTVDHKIAIPKIPKRAILQNLTLQWPLPKMYATS